jgi:hypothetical protein
MNSNSSRAGGSIRTSPRSLEALMYVGTLGIAIAGAVSGGLAAQAQEATAAKAAADVVRCPVGGMCRRPAGKQTAARTLVNTPLDAPRT